MIPAAVQILKSLVAPEEPFQAHLELDHAHWDRGTQTWRVHLDGEVKEAA